ncbi:hypothetical protein EVAR_21745_1 [Eumeta japonica]|uniref:Uncharacterized protein n=1 Tax=Eumeta variegata TaxID=151549 RepID=A0A4C1ZPI5_EUMVA|nr:hypothetical protein EVAR_21745_1 [Eumeta japonica]
MRICKNSTELDLLPLKLRRPPLSLVYTQLNALRESKQPLVGVRCEARFEARREENREARVPHQVSPQVTPGAGRPHRPPLATSLHTGLA